MREARLLIKAQAPHLHFGLVHTTIIAQSIFVQYMYMYQLISNYRVRLKIALSSIVIFINHLGRKSMDYAYIHVRAFHGTVFFYKRTNSGCNRIYCCKWTAPVIALWP